MIRKGGVGGDAKERRIPQAGREMDGCVCVCVCEGGMLQVFVGQCKCLMLYADELTL